jgi:glucose-1-phosphate adenylyltransferase
MTNRDWPIYASPDQAESAQIENGLINRSVVGSGSIVDGASLDHAMLRRSVMVTRDARLEHCIVMERSRIGQGARIRRAIIDQDNDIPPGEQIGFDLEQDRRRFHVTESGIVVVPRQFFPPRGNIVSGSLNVDRIRAPMSADLDDYRAAA